MKIDSLVARHHLNTSIRRFFAAKDYLEIETPICVPAPGMETHLDYFETSWIDHKNRNRALFLRSSPEIHMKQVLSAKHPKIYQIAKSFRNFGEKSDWHNPEFTLLEWYEADISFDDFMSQTHELLVYICDYINSKFNIQYLSLKDEPLKMSVFEAFKKYTGIDLIDQDPDLAQKCRRLNFISVRQDDDFETAFFKVMLDVVEPELKSLKYVLLYDYPASQAALSVRENGRAKRFEIYVDGIELCNAFQELVGYEANMARYAEIEQARTELSKQKTLKDEGFFESIRKGLPESCGNALGLDRLLALILGHKNIDSVIPFGGRIYSVD